MSIYQSIKNFGKKALLVSGLVAILNSCAKQEPATSKQHYVDLNNDSKKEIVFAKYKGKGWGDNLWDLYVAGEPPRKIFTLKGTNKFRFEDMDKDGYPDIVYELYAGSGWGDSVWGVYFVKNDKGAFDGKPTKLTTIKR